MATSSDGRPFTDKIIQLREEGLRYADLEACSGRARSTAWFNNLVNGSSAWSVSPPPEHTVEHLAVLMSTTGNDVRQMIAEEWYGIRATEYSRRVRSLAPRLDALTEEDAALVERLVQRLQSDAGPSPAPSGRRSKPAR